MINERAISPKSVGAESPEVSGAQESETRFVAAAKGGSFLFIGRLFDFASRFVFGLIVARSLGAEGLGLYMLGVTAAVALATLARLGLSEGMVHFLPDALYKRDTDRVWGILQVGLVVPALVGAIFGLLLFGLADLLAEGLFHEPEMATVLRWISIAVPIIALGRALMAATRGFKYMRYEVYADSIVFSVTRLSLTVLFLAIGMGLAGALAAFVIGWLASLALMFFYLNRLFPLKRSFGTAKRNVRQLLSYSAPLSVSQVVLQLRGSFELLMLGVFSTVAVAGIYSAAGRIMVIGGLFLAAIELVAKPIVADLYHRADKIQLGKLYKTLTRWSLAFILPYIITVIMFAGPILAIFGDEFEEGAIVLIIISAGTLVNAATGICGSIIVMTGHSRMVLINSLLSVGFSVALSAVLIPPYGLVGAAIGVAVSLTLINTLRLIEVYWFHKLWPYDWRFIKPVLAASVAALVAYFMNSWLPAEQSILYLILNISILWLTYLSVTFLLGLTEEDRLVLNRARTRFEFGLFRRPSRIPDESSG